MIITESSVAIVSAREQELRVPKGVEEDQTCGTLRVIMILVDLLLRRLLTTQKLRACHYRESIVAWLIVFKLHNLFTNIGVECTHINLIL